MMLGGQYIQLVLIPVLPIIYSVHLSWYLYFSGPSFPTFKTGMIIIKHSFFQIMLMASYVPGIVLDTDHKIVTEK